MLNIKSEVVRFSEEELKSYIRRNKDPEDSMISYYMNHLSSFFDKTRDKYNIKSIINEEFYNESDYFNLSTVISQYAIDNKLSEYEETELRHKSEAVFFENTTKLVDHENQKKICKPMKWFFLDTKKKYYKGVKDKIVIQTISLSIRGSFRLSFDYQLLFNCETNVLETIINFDDSLIEKKLNKLQKKNDYFKKKWQKISDIVLFGDNARMKIHFSELSKKKIKEIQFFILSILKKSYVVTNYENYLGFPVKIASLQELLTNEREIQLKRANSEDITDHPDISFPFAERYLCWLQKSIHYDNLECFKFCSEKQYDRGCYFHKMDLSVFLTFEKYSFPYDFCFFVNGDDENASIDFYKFNKKVKSCVIKDSAHFPEECRDYIKQEIENFINNRLVQYVLKLKIIKPNIVKPLKSRHGKILSNLKVIFNGYYSMEMLNEERLPISLKCRKTEFDLSKKQSVWKIEEYEEELLSGVEREELKEVLSPDKKDIIYPAQESQPVKSANKVNRL